MEVLCQMTVFLVCSGDGAQQLTHAINMCQHSATAQQAWPLYTGPTPCSAVLQKHLILKILKVTLIPDGVRCLQPTSYLTFQRFGKVSHLFSHETVIVFGSLGTFFLNPCSPFLSLCPFTRPSTVQFWAFFLALGRMCLLLSLPLHIHNSLFSFSSTSLQHCQQLAGCFHVLMLSQM